MKPKNLRSYYYSYSSSRREFLTSAACCSAALLGPWNKLLSADDESTPKMQLGLCTYLWGKDWDLPTLIANCEKADIHGLELRTEHKHGVEPTIGKEQRKEVKKRFADSRITLVSFGSNVCFDSPDPAKLKANIDTAQQFLLLSRDCGASGVKVKPNDFHKDVPHEKTIEQIGTSLNALGKFAADLGQEVRLEVHGTCCELPTMRQIMDIADHPNVGLCWNSNPNDLTGKGLEYNFNLVKDRLGATTHVRELNDGEYPYAELFALLKKNEYSGWILLECRQSPKDLVAALVEQRKIFEQMIR